MRMAIAHDWLVTIGGSERVLEQMLQLYPQADLVSLVDFLNDTERSIVGGRHAQTSFLQHWPWARTLYRNYLPLMPLAVESLDLSSYDMVLSSSHAVIKGVITGPDQLHVCYCYSPMRYAWDLQAEYLKSGGLERGVRGWLTRALLVGMRMWDLRTVPGVDHFVAISHHIARRIRKVYGRDASVIYPPVDTAYFHLDETPRDDYYVTASRLVPYKRVDLIVAAFAALPHRRLVVIGEGPQLEALRKSATSNVEFLGYQDPSSLRHHLQRARAFVFAAREDFGIAPLEAQACGTPVVAFGRGGALETVCGMDSAHPTGLFFPEQSVECLCEAIRTFESQARRIAPSRCHEQAAQFSRERFSRALTSLIDREWTEFRRRTRAGVHERANAVTG